MSGTRGRPSLKTPEICAEICERIAQGETLEDICRSEDDEGNLREDMPASRTVRTWEATDEEFSADVARARVVGYAAIAERTRLVARGKKGSSGDVNRDKLIIDTDFKLLACWDPKRFGNKQIHTGPDGESPVRVNLYIPDNGRDAQK